MPGDVVRVGMGNEGEAFRPVGVQPERGPGKQDASFDELVGNRGFQKDRKQKVGSRAGAGTGGRRIRAPRVTENRFAETAGVPWRWCGGYPRIP